MLRSRTLWLTACLIATVTTSAFAQGNITWAPNLSSALSMASRQNQLVLVHFWAPGCGPCMELERNVFNKPEVAQAISQNFVAVKVNAHAMPDTARKYNVDRWPMDVIITPAGYPLHSMVSPQDPREYTQVLYRVAAQRKPGERISQSNPTPPAADQLAQSGWGRQPAEQQASTGNFAQNDFGQGNSGASSFTQQNTQAPTQSQFTENRFAQQDPRGTNSDSGWGGQQSNFGPTYGEQVNPQGSPNTQFNAGGNQQPMGPRETVNPYINQSSQPPVNGPQAPPSFAQRQGAPSQPAPQGNTAQPPMGLDGYCPVALISNGKWTKGDPKFGIIHRGRLYLFASEAEKQTFWQDPDRFAPILSGNDPVEFAESGRIVQGSRKHGVFYRNQIFLFTSEDSLQRFWGSPKRYADVAVAAMARASEGGRMR